MELKTKLKKLAEELGADYFGIANLSPAQKAIENLWEKVTAQFPRAISFGIALPHEIVNQQPNRFSSNLDWQVLSSSDSEYRSKSKMGQRPYRCIFEGHQKADERRLWRMSRMR